MSSHHHQLLAQHWPPLQHQRSIHLLLTAFDTIHSIPCHPWWVAVPNHHNWVAHGDVKPGECRDRKGITDPCYVAPNQYCYSPPIKDPKKDEEMQVYTVLLPPSLIMRMCGQIMIQSARRPSMSTFPLPSPSTPRREHLCFCRPLPSTSIVGFEWKRMCEACLH